MSDENNASAYDRIIELVSIALDNDNSIAANTGNWSAADFDELVFLTKLVPNKLPPAFRNLVTETAFVSSARGQRELSTRLQRSIEVVAKYGQPATQKEPDPLVPEFSLSNKARDRVLKLCSDMRKIVLAAEGFDEPHKVLMLNRIAAVEKQALDKRGKLDVVRGAASDIGETLGKFGKDIKPLTDRFKEVVSITRKATPEYDQIPAPEELKKLPSPDDTE